MKALFLLFLICVTSAHAEGLNRQIPNSLQEFWSKFRNVTLAGNKLEVIVLANFPFETRGTMDWDPIVKHDKSWFLSTYDVLLAMDPGLSASPSTMRILINETEHISSEHWSGDNHWRVGDFIFKKIDSRWFFSMAYWDME